MDRSRMGLVGGNFSTRVGSEGKEQASSNVISLPLARRKHSALIVEDDMTSIYVLDLALRQTGLFAHLDWATSAEEAMSYIGKRMRSGRRLPYDLVIIDIFLDGVRTGVDLWQFLNESNVQNMPVIMTSGISEDRFTQLMGRYYIMPKFLKKPFKMQSCITAIEESLNKPVLQ